MGFGGFVCLLAFCYRHTLKKKINVLETSKNATNVTVLFIDPLNNIEH